ncbi:drug/metabolite exporter YedA [Luteimonas kalidii]|uniref:Drug/metabolite exporter YedA n=1 Tax=Luteimonas kalidii TaxID=3042025 RepID=A0ABT6JX67_9GAMM|nr:drug/metabolite exporter YedA [Luteimonas kalidii]MDH5835298.1 drug/metabolite exporter YedA [Luteimonas kalidii]
MRPAPASVGPASASPSAIALALASVYLVWGSTYLAIRFALEGGWPPLLMGGVRFLACGVALYAVLRWRGMAAPTRIQWRNAAFVGVLLLGVGNGLVCVAEQTVSSGLAAVAVASMPLWMAVFAMLRGEHPGRMEWLGLGVGFVGVAWLNAGSSLAASPAGLVALLVAAIAWAYGSVWSRGRGRDLPSPFMSAAAQMLCGGAAMLVVGLVIGERFADWPTPQGMLSVGYLATVGSLIGFSAYIWLLQHVRPALAGSYAYVNPVIAVLLGAWLAGERFGAHELGAMAVVLAGVVAISLARARKAAPAPLPAQTADADA